MKKILFLALCLMASLAGYSQTVDFDRAAKKMTITGLTAGTLGTIITDGTGGTENLRGATVTTSPHPDIVSDDDPSGSTRPGSTIQTVNDDTPIETLVITGQLNGADLKIVADMARRWLTEISDGGTDFEFNDVDPSYTMKKYVRTMTYGLTGGLKKLDLSGAQIVKDATEENNVYFDISSGSYADMTKSNINIDGGALDPCSYFRLEENGTSGTNGKYSVTADNEIGDAMFVGCNMLEELVLPNTATSIGHVAFMREMNLDKITIPASMTKIKSYAFYQAFNMNRLMDDPRWFQSPIPATTITFEESENLIDIEPMALDPVDGMTIPATGTSPVVNSVVTALSQLGDYAVDTDDADNLVLKSSMVAGELKATATPPNKYWTFSCGVDIVLPDNVKAYTCRIVDGETDIVELTDAQLDADEDGKRVIPANNGVLLACPDDAESNAYNMVVQYNAGITAIATTDARTWGDQNALVPVIRTAHYEPGDYYMLYHGKWVVLAGDGASVPAGKALLKK